ncbi:allene oxide synthase 1, chloroplastic [Olea europaea subsp. europaea]|uniref:Allene oxide synthase 1, chloroplastic n=1 Tax=Olea europaea subsp. europaea TaxID=158383 RepID=A0A8S0TTX1_OLEEU|nr:allene oxide synthase 1, chloroplastic [Olea europaea subsp. europaea]
MIMASSPLAFYSSQFHYSLQRSQKLASKPLKPAPFFQPIKASVSKKPSISTPPLEVSRIVPPKPTKLPIRKIPVDYGLPLIGPWKDRQDYFYDQCRDEYFKSRIQKYQSTVFRTNTPPGPLITFNSKVIALLDDKSFPVLFDTDKVEKKDVFTSTYMPSTELTGGYKIPSYLDPLEPNHAKLKKIVFFLLFLRRDHVIREFHSSLIEFFDDLERELATKGKASFGEANDQVAFTFLARSLYGANPVDTKLGSDGPKIVRKWVLFQLHPLVILGLPRRIEDGIFHSIFIQHS